MYIFFHFFFHFLMGQGNLYKSNMSSIQYMKLRHQLLLFQVVEQTSMHAGALGWCFHKTKSGSRLPLESKSPQLCRLLLWRTQARNNAGTLLPQPATGINGKKNSWENRNKEWKEEERKKKEWKNLQHTVLSLKTTFWYLGTSGCLAAFLNQHNKLDLHSTTK